MGRLADGIRSYLSAEIPLRDPKLVELFGLGPTTAGASVTEWSALNYSAVWQAVRAISEPVGSLPLFHYRRLQPRGKERISTSRIHRLIHDQFNPEMTAVVARTTLHAHVLTWGNGYAEIERDQLGRPLALWVLTPDRVTPDRNRAGEIIYRIYNTDGGTTEIPAMNMLHVPGLGFNGLTGYSVIAKARESIGLGTATEKYGAQFFGNGATSSLVLTHPGTLSKTAAENIKTSVQSAIGGENRHRLLIFEEGMKAEKISIPPDDAQFLETRKFQVLEIARWFNLPPHKLRDLERATYSNIEQQAIDFVTDTLRYWLVVWEQELRRKLIPELEWNQQFVEHVVDGLLRGDSAARHAAYAAGHQNGYYSSDDIREMENLNPLPDGAGDQYFVQVNMVPLDRVNDLVDKQVSTAAPADPTPLPTPRALPDPDAVARMVAAQRALFVDAMGRMVRRETQGLRRAAKKGAAGLEQWRAEFYPKHGAIIRDALLPAVQAHVSYVAATIGAPELTRQLADQHIADSLHELETLPPEELENAVDLMATRWEVHRPAALADSLMTEELRHALTRAV